MKLIPGTDGFYATEDGRIYDEHNVERNYYRNGDGYITASVRINGVWITFGVQRLIALAYLEKDRTNERDFVNHIDGDVTNNHVNNLEWVTTYENNIHAKLLSGNPEKPVLILVSPVFEYSFAKTKEIACELIGCSFKELWKAVKNKTMINGWEVRYNQGPLPAILRKKSNPYLLDKVSIKLLDVDSKDIKSFESLKKAAEFLGTTASLVCQTLTTTDKVRLCMRKYIIVKDSDVFPNITEEDIERLRQHRSRSVLAVEVSTGKPEIFQRAVDFYRKHRFSKKAVTVTLKEDRLREIGGYVFLYLSERNSQRIKDYLAKSGKLD